MSIIPFLDLQFRGELKSIYEMKKKLFNKAKTLPTKLLDIMTTQLLKQRSISLINLELPFHSFISFFLSVETKFFGLKLSPGSNPN